MRIGSQGSRRWLLSIGRHGVGSILRPEERHPPACPNPGRKSALGWLSPEGVAHGSVPGERVGVRGSQEVAAIGARGFAAEGGTYLPREEVKDRVVNVVKNFQKVDPGKVTPESNFTKDLGLDSLDAVEVMMAIEEEFGVEIPDAEADKMETCSQAIDYLASHPTAK